MVTSGFSTPVRRFSVAPMMDRTDRHCRYFHRLLSRRALLYTEMVTARALIHGDRRRLLGLDPAEHPVALQLGGSDPGELARAAEYGAEAGFDEINLNVGCPSGRVREGRFGACLFLEPETVARAVEAMRRAVDLPVTVKTRIGVDHQPVGAPLREFVAAVSAAGCRVFVIHARKAWLSGLSPRENREIPPLDYAAVHELKDHFPELAVIINGGIRDLASAAAHLCRVDGVMVGRAAYRDPWMLADVDRLLGDVSRPRLSRQSVVRSFAGYVREQLRAGVPLHTMTRHVLGLYSGEPGARTWRRWLSENVSRPGADENVLLEALTRVETVVARAA